MLIFDFLRQKWIVLTPEEWVRQHFTHFLVEHKGYPRTLMANEVTLHVGPVSRRADTVLYRRDLTAQMILEYKAPTVPITQKVFEQIGRYNIALRVDYLVVSNGLNHYCCRMDYAQHRYQYLSDIPPFREL